MGTMIAAMEVMIALYSSITFLWIAVLASRMRRIREILNQLERKIDRLVADSDAQERSPAWKNDMETLIQQGKKAEAVKLYREMTGAGPLEAAYVIDLRSDASKASS